MSTYKVKVSGSVLYETDDLLVAGAVAHSYKGIGWKDVKIEEVTDEILN